jgi:hypothetical protein
MKFFVSGCVGKYATVRERSEDDETNKTTKFIWCEAMSTAGLALKANLSKEWLIAAIGFHGQWRSL